MLIPWEWWPLIMFAVLVMGLWVVWAVEVLRYLGG